MEALGSPSISRAPMGGAMLSEYQKLVYADDRYSNNILSFAYLCRSFFKIITWKERKVYVLSKKLHQSVPYAQNESCLARKQTENG